MRAREYLLALIGSLAVAMLVTWPLASDLTGQLPHDSRFAPFAGSDMNIWVWNFWWAGEVVANGEPAFYSDRIFPPTGHSLAFHTHTFLWGLASLPLQWLGGLFFAVNAMFLLLFATAATAAYALARELRLRPLSSALVGLAWAFSPYFVQKSLVHLNLGASPWLPLALLFALRWMNKRPSDRAWTHALGFGLVAGLCLLTGSLQTVYLAVACLVLFIVRPRCNEDLEPRRTALLHPVPVAIALLAFAMTARPFLNEWYREFAASGGYGAHPQEYHPQLSDFLEPSGLHPVFAGLGSAAPVPDAEFKGERSEHAGLSLRLSLLALAAIGLFRYRTARPWAIGFGLLFLLAWDPGPDPEGWLSSFYRKQPPFELLRVPARFLPAALLFLSITAGFGLQALLERPRGSLIAGALSLGLLFESWIGTYPTHAVQVPVAVERIANGPSGGLVLTLPYLPGATEAMLWQTQHGHDVPVSYVARTQPAQLESVRSATPDLFAISLGLAYPEPAALALDLRHADIHHILFRDTGKQDPSDFYAVLDAMEGWERSEDFGDGVEWWYRTAP